VQAARSALDVDFQIDGESIENVATFKYLGRIIAEDGTEWATVWHNLSRGKKAWAKLNRVIAREGANPRSSAFFYKAVVQSVLLYGCETWTLDEALCCPLTNFHHSAVGSLTGSNPKLNAETQQWEKPHGILELAWMQPLGVYISCRMH
jgi:hypothetical protein